jgi:hypothetical protein
MVLIIDISKNQTKRIPSLASAMFLSLRCSGCMFSQGVQYELEQHGVRECVIGSIAFAIAPAECGRFGCRNPKS